MIFEGFLSAFQRPQLYSRSNFDKYPSLIRTANAPAHTDLLQDKIAASVTINIHRHVTLEVAFNLCFKC